MFCIGGAVTNLDDAGDEPLRLRRVVDRCIEERRAYAEEALRLIQRPKLGLLKRLLR